MFGNLVRFLAAAVRRSVPLITATTTRTYKIVVNCNGIKRWHVYKTDVLNRYIFDDLDPGCYKKNTLYSLSHFPAATNKYKKILFIRVSVALKLESVQVIPVSLIARYQQVFITRTVNQFAANYTWPTCSTAPFRSSSWAIVW